LQETEIDLSCQPRSDSDAERPHGRRTTEKLDEFAPLHL
jgi:hypothetical protein